MCFVCSKIQQALYAVPAAIPQEALQSEEWQELGGIAAPRSRLPTALRGFEDPHLQRESIGEIPILPECMDIAAKAPN